MRYVLLVVAVAFVAVGCEKKVEVASGPVQPIASGDIKTMSGMGSLNSGSTPAPSATK